MKRSSKCWLLAEGLLVVSLLDASYGPSCGRSWLFAGVACVLLGVVAIAVAGLAGVAKVQEDEER